MTSKLIDHLASEHIWIRRMNKDDLSRLKAICSASSNLSLSNDKPYNSSKIEQLYQTSQKDYDELGFGMLSVDFRSNGKLLGICGFNKGYHQLSNTWQLQWLLKSPYKEIDVLHETLVLIIDYAFSELAVTKISSQVHQNQPHSIKQLLALGFKNTTPETEQQAYQILELLPLAAPKATYEERATNNQNKRNRQGTIPRLTPPGDPRYH